MSWHAWWQHAFAVAPHAASELTDAERAVIEELCRRVAEHGMTVPMQLWIESSAPLTGFAAAGLKMVEPLAFWRGGEATCRELTTFVARRGAVEYLVERLEWWATQVEQQPTARQQQEPIVE